MTCTSCPRKKILGHLCIVKQSAVEMLEIGNWKLEINTVMRKSSAKPWQTLASLSTTWHGLASTIVKIAAHNALNPDKAWNQRILNTELDQNGRQMHMLDQETAILKDLFSDWKLKISLP